MVNVQKLNEIIMIYFLKDLLYLSFDNASDHAGPSLNKRINDGEAIAKIHRCQP